MAVEIERKFLVINNQWRNECDPGVDFQQGYLVGSEQASVRVRLEGDKAYLNIKSATLGVRRLEYEYAIPVAEAKEMLKHLCAKPLVEKTRYFIHRDNLCWEIDVFKGENAGLIVAEVELQTEAQSFDKPAWLGEEVSHDPRYYNVSLVKHPYKDWGTRQ